MDINANTTPKMEGDKPKPQRVASGHPRRERNKNDGEQRQPAPSSPLNEELKVIRRVARALEGLTPEARARVLSYIVDSGVRASTPSYVPTREQFDAIVGQSR